MDKEQDRLLMMVSCLMENIENAGNEYKNMMHRNGSVLDSYKQAQDRIDELLDRNNISEYQKAFHQLDKAVKEVQSCLSRMPGFSKQLEEIGKSL